jgi:hypothetical protein
MTATDRRALRGAASERLLRALISIAAQGQRAHCSDPASHALWLSEDEQERSTAAELCPVIIECAEAAEANGERFRVWGAKDFTRVPAKPGPKPQPRPHFGGFPAPHTVPGGHHAARQS